MTREEAIEVIKQDIPCEQDADLIEAFDMAIQALEKENIYDDKEHYVTISKALYDKLNIDYEQALSQEPCDDVVSRQAVIYYIKGHIHEIITESGTDKNAHTNSILKALINGVETMPTVNPQPCDDAISREAVYQLLMNMASSAYGFEEIRRIVDDLPPVTQKSAKDYLDMADRKAKKIKDALTDNSQKYGKWIKQTLSVKPFGEDTVLCDQCAFMTDKDSMYNYCPNCGAKMIEPQESEG